uniref:Uncharacterized protein n=1 Tax=Anguilla anguilla TaxID=7936 RepID=A0A0E9VJ26_ANGAN
MFRTHPKCFCQFPRKF